MPKVPALLEIWYLPGRPREFVQRMQVEKRSYADPVALQSYFHRFSHGSWCWSMHVMHYPRNMVTCPEFEYYPVWCHAVHQKAFWESAQSEAVAWTAEPPNWHCEQPTLSRWPHGNPLLKPLKKDRSRVEMPLKKDRSPLSKPLKRMGNLSKTLKEDRNHLESLK